MKYVRKLKTRLLQLVQRRDYTAAKGGYIKKQNKGFPIFLLYLQVETKAFYGRKD